MQRTLCAIGIGIVTAAALAGCATTIPDDHTTPMATTSHPEGISPGVTTRAVGHEDVVRHAYLQCVQWIHEEVKPRLQQCQTITVLSGSRLLGSWTVLANRGDAPPIFRMVYWVDGATRRRIWWLDLHTFAILCRGIIIFDLALDPECVADTAPATTLRTSSPP